MNEKKRSLFLSAIVLISCVCLLVARHNHVIGHRTFPWHLAEKWYCEEIDMTLKYVVNEDGYLIDSPNSVLTVGSYRYEVFVGFYGTNLISFQIIEEDNAQKSALRGTWNYWMGNLVIRISEDSIIDGQCRRLVFIPCEE